MIELEHSCLLNMASLGIQLGEHSDSRRFAQEAVDIDPEFGRGWHILGMANRHLGRYEEAIKQFNTAVLLCPHEASFQTRLDEAIQAKKDNSIRNQERSAKQKCDSAAESWDGGHHKEAIVLWQGALVEYGELGQPFAQSAVHSRLGAAYRGVLAGGKGGGHREKRDQPSKEAQSSLQHYEAALAALKRVESVDVPTGQEAFLTLDVARGLFLCGEDGKAKSKLEEASGLAQSTLGMRSYYHTRIRERDPTSAPH